MFWEMELPSLKLRELLYFFLKNMFLIFQEDQVYFNTPVPTQANMNQDESRRINTSQHESTRINASQHETARVRHELIRPRNYHSLPQFQLVKYDNSLIGLSILLIPYLEPGLKQIKNKLDKYLDAIQVFVNNFSLLVVNQFIYQE